MSTEICSLGIWKHKKLSSVHVLVSTSSLAGSLTHKMMIIFNGILTICELYHFNDGDNGCFKHVVIDEAVQCKECAFLIPISFVDPKVGKVMMADHRWFITTRPITLNNRSKHYDLTKSILERYVQIYLNIVNFVSLINNLI